MNDLTVIGPGSEVLIRPLMRVMPALEVARTCDRELSTPACRHVERHPRFAERAIDTRAVMLANFLDVDRASQALAHALMIEPLDRADALTMLSFLYHSFGDRSADGAGKIAGCIAIFDGDALGRASGLWKPLGATPAVLSLAIQLLLNKGIAPQADGKPFDKKWSPKPPEVREACERARARLSRAHTDCHMWLEQVRIADALLLEHNHEAWETPYLTPFYQQHLARMLEYHEIEADVEENESFGALVKREQAKLLTPPKPQKKLSPKPKAEPAVNQAKAESEATQPG